MTWRLQEIAARYTTETTRVVTLPTVLVIQVGSLAYEADTSTALSLQLDKAGRVDEIATLAAAGAITPAEAVAAVRQARDAPGFGPVTTMAGYVVATLGFALVIHPTWVSLPPHALLGLVFAAILQLTRPFPALTPVVPIFSALVVAVLASWFVVDAAHESVLMVITPALVAMLPGVALTVSAVELAGGQIISGSSRAVHAVAQLVRWRIRCGPGHPRHAAEPRPVPMALMGPWSLYLAILVMAIGLRIFLSALRGALPWLAAAAGPCRADAGRERLANEPCRFRRSPADGALCDDGRTDQDRAPGDGDDAGGPSGHSPVPGALSLASVSHAATGNASVAGIAVAGSAVMSLALGTMVGWSIFQAVDAAPKRLKRINRDTAAVELP